MSWFNNYKPTCHCRLHESIAQAGARIAMEGLKRKWRMDDIKQSIAGIDHIKREKLKILSMCDKLFIIIVSVLVVTILSIVLYSGNGTLSEQESIQLIQQTMQINTMNTMNTLLLQHEMLNSIHH